MSELKSTNLASWGFTFIVIILGIVAIEEMLHLLPAEELVNWYIPAGNFVLIAAFLSIMLALFAFWNGNKKMGTVFLFLIPMFVALFAITANDLGFLRFIRNPLDPEEYLITGHAGLMVGLVCAAYVTLMGFWASRQQDGDRSLATFFFFLAAYVVVESIACEVFASIDEDVMSYNLYDMVRAIAGAILFVAVVYGFHFGFVKGCLKGRGAGADETAEMKSIDVKGITGIVMGMFVTILGLEAALVFFLPKYALDTYIFVFCGLVMSIIFMILAYWNGDKRVVLSMAFSISFFAILTYMNNNSFEELGHYPMFVPGLMFALFAVFCAVYMGIKTDISKVYLVGIALLGVAALIAGTMNFVENPIANEDMINTIMLLTGIVEVAAGLIFTYVGYAKTGVIKLPLP